MKYLFAACIFFFSFQAYSAFLSININSNNKIGPSNQSNYGASGFCWEGGGTVSITISANGENVTRQNIACSFQYRIDSIDKDYYGWSVSGLDVSSLSEGQVTITVTQGSRSPKTLTVTKKTIFNPIVKITSSFNITASNESSYSVSGTCESGKGDVTVLVGAVSPATQPPCSSGAWSVTGLDVSSLNDGNVVIEASQTDNQNRKGSATKTVIKGATAPVVSLDPHPDNPDILTTGFTFANQDDFSLSGGCTQGKGNVEITATVSGATPVTLFTTSCSSSGAWSAENLDVSSLPDGDVTIKASQTDALNNNGFADTTVKLDSCKEVHEVPQNYCSVKRKDMKSRFCYYARSEVVKKLKTKILSDQTIIAEWVTEITNITNSRTPSSSQQQGDKDCNKKTQELFAKHAAGII